jgi:predicted nucleic acid-binding protein
VAPYFVDTSALAKRYLSETGSQLVDTIAREHAGELFIAAISPVEVTAAVTRRARGGYLPGEEASKILSAFRHHAATEYRLVRLTDSVLAKAMDLAQRHGLRGYDAVQLACAMEVATNNIADGRSPLILVSSDAELNAAGRREGLTVLDPNA